MLRGLGTRMRDFSFTESVPAYRRYFRNAAEFKIRKSLFYLLAKF